MLKEIFIFALIYVFALGSHTVGHRLHAWREARRRKADALAALAPLDAMTPAPGLHAICTAAKCRTHVIAFGVAAISNPASAETIKHYVVHFLIYSGYVIPPH